MPYVAFPFGNTVGRCFMPLTRLNRFSSVRACRSLCLRTVMVVASHDVRLDSCWLAEPWQGRNCTSWMDEASSGGTPGHAVKGEAKQLSWILGVSAGVKWLPRSLPHCPACPNPSRGQRCPRDY